MKIIACGGRDFDDVPAVWHALDTLHGREPVTELIEGGARGADRCARAWAASKKVPVRTFEADWDRLGKRAGHERNYAMLMVGRPELVVAFPGGRGTANMVEQAQREGVPVWRPYPNRLNRS